LAPIRSRTHWTTDLVDEELRAHAETMMSITSRAPERSPKPKAPVFALVSAAWKLPFLALTGSRLRVHNQNNCNRGPKHRTPPKAGMLLCVGCGNRSLLPAKARKGNAQAAETDEKPMLLSFGRRPGARCAESIMRQSSKLHVCACTRTVPASPISEALGPS
jgi:hypothetical protein